MVSQPRESAWFGCRPSYYRFNTILMQPAFHSPQSEHLKASSILPRLADVLTWLFSTRMLDSPQCWAHLQFSSSSILKLAQHQVPSCCICWTVLDYVFQFSLILKAFYSIGTWLIVQQGSCTLNNLFFGVTGSVLRSIFKFYIICVGIY